jgi:hypothetical protein
MLMAAVLTPPIATTKTWWMSLLAGLDARAFTIQIEPTRSMIRGDSRSWKGPENSSLRAMKGSQELEAFDSWRPKPRQSSV